MSKLHVIKTLDYLEFQEFVKSTVPYDEIYLVKPNWFHPRYASYTDPKILDAVLTALPGKKYILESHTYQRNEDNIDVAAEEVDKKRDYIREQDKKFIDNLGFSRVLKKHDAEYINITEEWWKGETVNPGIIKQIVESMYTPIHRHELYGCVPKKLMKFRGRTMINLAKLKMESGDGRDEFSLTMKNLFGLIPHPNRLEFHNDLPRNISDMNKIYCSLFNVIGICEAIKNLVVFRQTGKYTTSWNNFDVFQNSGFAVCGKNLNEVDIYIGRIFGFDFTTKPLVQLAQEIYGLVDDVNWPNLIDRIDPFAPVACTYSKNLIGIVS